jgi:hypothetical protein
MALAQKVANLRHDPGSRSFLSVLDRDAVDLPRAGAGHPDELAAGRGQGHKCDVVLVV